MPKTTGSIEKIQSSVRLTTVDHAWVNVRAKELGTYNEVIVQLVSDARTFYSLPDNIRQKLENDAKAMGKSLRDYVVFLLGKRYEELLREELAGASTKKR
jgi:hypothetical protein